MENDFGQPALIYCGGYNCRHRWAPVRGRMDHKLFVHESWDKLYKTATKNERKQLDSERETALRISRSTEAKIEMTANFKALDREMKDADCIYDGKLAQLKSPDSKSYRTIERNLTDKQADLIIVDLKNNNEDFEEAIKRARKWNDRHPNKEIIVIYKNKMYEV